VAAVGNQGRWRIADELMLSVRTVDNHLQHAYTKLGITGRDQLQSVITGDAAGDY
jgi:DNA-binding CsgD family transcriptional regulator